MTMPKERATGPAFKTEAPFFAVLLLLDAAADPEVVLVVAETEAKVEDWTAEVAETDTVLVPTSTVK